MDADRIDVITEWDAVTFSGGYEGLRSLADRGFSGAVTNGTAWAFLLNGRVVGVADGDLDAFADADGTAYEAPHPSVPLLFAMEAADGDVRAQYYTNDTPLSEADRTLSAGGFTGFIELSENVLSGDYYVAYYGGESQSCAFVGNASQLVTGTEAFDRADDEVGIYTVYDVDLDVREIPDADTVSGVAPAGSGTGDEGSGSDGEGDPYQSRTDEDPSQPRADEGPSQSRTDEGPSQSRTDEDPSQSRTDERTAEPRAGEGGSDEPRTGEEAPDEPQPDDGPDGSEKDGPGEGAQPEVTTGTDEGEGTDSDDRDDDPDTTNDRADRPDAVGAESAASSAVSEDTEEAEATQNPDPAGAPDDPGSTGAESTDASDTADRSPSTSEPVGSSVSGPADTASGPSNGTTADAADEDVFSEEAEWREAKSIPALDPSNASKNPSERPDRREPDPGRRGSGTGSSRPEARSARASSQRADAPPTDSAGSEANNEQADGEGDADAASQSTEARKEAVAQRPSVRQNKLQRQVNRLESTLEEVEAEREAAIAERDEIASERDDIAAERDEYREEAERLADQVSDLESELERVRSDLREARQQLPDGEQVLSPADALAGTNLFIRYETQGGATLTKALDGEVDREELAGNLRVEHHTTFDDGDVIVDGQPFREFLTGTMEYGFTEWLVTELPFEIRETGNVSALRDLYDAIPEIDRAEIGGSVPLETDAAEGDDGATTTDRTFDLVLRDRMGEPLFVADLNDSRDPTAQATLEELVRDASRLAESKHGFATGFAVTASFFEPGALETVDDATGSGLLSRGKQKSYVRVSRKQGFHMCLAESRDGGFHLTVPEI